MKYLVFGMKGTAQTVFKKTELAPGMEYIFT